MLKQDLKYVSDRYGVSISQSKIQAYEKASDLNPSRYPPLSPRIYPGHYAPVVFKRNQRQDVSFMRYGAYPPNKLGEKVRYKTFNARRDNLRSFFWSEAFMHFHGFVIVEKFYEWVVVRDLIKDGRVSLDDVKLVFERQKDLRRQKIEKSGVKYKPTAAEKKDPLDRSIIVEFRPTTADNFVAPVIFSIKKNNEGVDAGFAIVTDDPPTEVLAAGHDRTPIFLSEHVISEWIDVQEGHSDDFFLDLLGRRSSLIFTYQIDPLQLRAEA